MKKLSIVLAGLVIGSTVMAAEPSSKIPSFTEAFKSQRKPASDVTYTGKCSVSEYTKKGWVVATTKSVNIQVGAPGEVPMASISLVHNKGTENQIEVRMSFMLDSAGGTEVIPMFMGSVESKDVVASFESDRKNFDTATLKSGKAEFGVGGLHFTQKHTPEHVNIIYCAAEAAIK